MTNLDEFDQPEELGPNNQGPRNMTSNLAEAWRSRPLFKLLVLLTVIGAVVAASIGLFSGSGILNQSRIAKPPEMTEAPGGKSSPFYIEQTKEAAERRAAAAMQSGGSALPTPVGQASDTEEMGGEGQKKDPLVELRAETEHMKQQLAQVQQQQQIQQQQVQQQPKAPPAPFDDSLAQAMQRQMQQLMESWMPHGIKTVDVTAVHENKERDESKAAQAGAAGANANGVAGAAVPPPPPPKILVPAGTVSYAQLLTEANSDVPGPILAQILSGPLSGARIIGQFQVMNDYLVLQFNLADRKGTDYSINTLALDTDTTLGGLATEVDERYFSRVLLPAGASFLQAVGQTVGQGGSSIATNGTTTIVSQSSRGITQGMFTGLGQAAQTAGQFFQNEANLIKPLVRVAAGTPMGLFFVSSVYDVSPQNAANPYGYGPNGPNGPYGAYPGMAGGYPGAGYPGAGYPGAGYPGAGYPGLGYPGAGYPGAGYPGAGGYPSFYGSSPGGYSPGATFGGNGVPGGGPGASYPIYPGANGQVPYPSAMGNSNTSNATSPNMPILQNTNTGAVSVIPGASVGSAGFGH